MATARYYRVTPRFWQDPDVRKWSEDMRLLALYLLTSPHRNMVGLYYCPTYYMAADLQWPAERVRPAFERLVSVRFVLFDPTTDVVLLRSALKYDTPSKGKQITGAVNALKAVPPTPLLRELLAAAKRYCPLLAEEMASEFKETLAALRTSPEATSETHRSDIEAAQIPVSDSESESESESESACDPRDSDADDPASLPGVPYQAIINAYHLQCGSWPKVRMLTPDRRKAIREWWAQIMDVHRFDLAFKKANQSDFLSGRSGKWSSPKPCDFDWLMDKSHLAAVLEGAYDNRASGPSPADTQAGLIRRPVSIADKLLPGETEEDFLREADVPGKEAPR